MSSTAKTPLEANRITLVHELRHHMHGILRGADLEQWRSTVTGVLLEGPTSISRKNFLEYFAESFVLYIYNQQELFMRDLKGHDMMKKALQTVILGVN